MSGITTDYAIPEDLSGTILEEIMYSKVHELRGAKKKFPAVCIESVLERAPEIRSFKKALTGKTPAIIAEVKKASPSAGLIRQDFDPVSIVREYQESGAAAVSVITEVQNFQGGLEILAALRWNSTIPLLRKDFIIDRYQVLEARHAGADAILLIAALLDTASLKNLRIEAEKYGMDALVEVHNEPELVRTLESGATLVGVNNRDLRTFEVTLETSLSLVRKMPKDVLPVAESGIRTSTDLRKLRDAGFKAFLVGEQLMRAESPGRALRELIQ